MFSLWYSYHCCSNIDICKAIGFQQVKGNISLNFQTNVTRPFIIPLSSALEVFQFLFNNITFGALPNNDFSGAGLPADKLKWKCAFSNYASHLGYTFAGVTTWNVKSAQSLASLQYPSFPKSLSSSCEGWPRRWSVVRSYIQSDGKHLNIPAWYFHLNLITVK